MKPQLRQAYEWVIIPSKGDDEVLTEGQFEFYKDRVQNKQMDEIFYDTFSIKPSFTVQAYRREAHYIKDKYPCQPCRGDGFLFEKDAEGVYLVCPHCEGTGVSLK